MKKIAAIVLVLIGAYLVVRWSRLPQRAAHTNLAGSTMGTTYTVRLARDVSATERQEWQRWIQDCVDGVDRRMSTYQADSEISRFNRSPSLEWFPVSRDTASVVAAALDVSRLTDGAFDITIGPLVNIWNFGPQQRSPAVPSEAEIAAARACVGYQQMEVRIDPPALRKTIPEVYLDLSGIAKGFAVDQVAALLEQEGVSAYMVEIGGEVRTKGTRRDGQPWRIGIERPVAGERSVQVILKLADAAVATSGDYRNFFQWEGQLYSHEIDPRTGRPVRHQAASVSVIDHSAMRADALATGLIVMQPDEAWRRAAELGLDVMMILRNDHGFEQRMTPGFEAALIEDIQRGSQ